MRRELPRHIDSRRSVSTADNADGRRFAQTEIHETELRQAQRTQQCGENTELCGSA